MPQPPYTPPDLAPCDFWLFPKLKTGLQSCRFATADDIKEKAKAGLRAIKKDDFKKCFKAWELFECTSYLFMLVNFFGGGYKYHTEKHRNPPT
jgi:hypothetical protein